MRVRRTQPFGRLVICQELIAFAGCSHSCLHGFTQTLSGTWNLPDEKTRDVSCEGFNVLMLSALLRLPTGSEGFAKPSNGRFVIESVRAMETAQ